MQLVFLGTGGSWPSPNRNVAAVGLKLGKEVILFDCGEGTQRQFMLSSLSFMQVKKILITHFHGDHFLGLPGLVQSMSLNNREDGLEIFGPQGTCILVKNLLNLGYFNPTFEVKVTDLKDGGAVHFENYDIKVRDACHNVPGIAFCIEEHMRPGKFDLSEAKALGIPEGPLYQKLQRGEVVEVDGKKFTPDMVMGPPRRGRKLVYSGDTSPCTSIVELARDCDVLIHDSTLGPGEEEKAVEYGHSTAVHAAEVARKTGAQILFLVHISPRYEDASILEEEARSIFPNTYAPTDFFEYDVKYRD